MTTKPLLDALRGTPQAVPPVWLMRQAGRYLPEYRKLRGQARDFLDFCFTPALAVEATLQPVRRFGMDGAILFSDILVIPHALGQRVAFEEGRGPVLEALADGSAVARLDRGAVAERLAPIYAALEELRTALPPACTLIGFAGAPWTLATYMVEGGPSRDFARVKSWAYRDPEGFRVLIDLLVDTVAAHLVAQVDAGAEAVQVFDSWAGVLPDDAFRDWSIAPVRAIVERFRTVHPEVPVIGFPNRAGVLYEPFARETGVDAVSIDTAVPCDWAARALQRGAAIQGNLDPALLLAGGAAMEAQIRAIRDRLSGGAHVFNLGHGVLPATPPDHVAELVEYVRAGP